MKHTPDMGKSPHYWLLGSIFTVLLSLVYFPGATTGELSFVGGNNVEGARYKFPFQDPSLSWDERVDDLVKRLTIDELVNQTITIYNNHLPTYGVPRLGVKPYIWISECLRGQVHTNGTAFPQSLGLAATFSNKLLDEISRAISYEVRAHWNHNAATGVYATFAGLSCFSPVINIMRHPLWGRNQETYGEDPFLSSVLVRSYVKGLQGDHPRFIRANAGCKHFDVHGGPENIPVTRFSFDANVSMHDWRMTFLPAFQACVEEGSYSLMCSYNRINGVPACANQKLLTNITRQEWGFKGYIVSDAGAIDNIIHFHKYAKDEPHAAAASINAGCNLELGGTVFKSIPTALKSDGGIPVQYISSGLTTLKTLQDRVKPLMYTRMRLGEFDPPNTNPYTKIPLSVVQSKEHQALALKAAKQSFVLLKNDKNTLPLTMSYKKVAVVGPLSNNLEQVYGDYAPDVNKAVGKTPWDSLQKVAADSSQADGCDNTACKSYNRSDMMEKISGADLIIICLGTGQNLEQEGTDRADLELPGKQASLLIDVATKGESSGATVILLLFNAGPLNVSWAKTSSSIHAMLACFFPAQATGSALYETLLAKNPDAVPAGRLPATWPVSMSQVPPMTNYTMEGRTYRYYKGTPLFPFGFGLSYTRFKYLTMKVAKKSIKAEEDLRVTVSFQNIGSLDADEVVQLYMRWPSSVSGAPKLQLVGFQRLSTEYGGSTLNGGITYAVVFTITSKQMAIWDDSLGKFVVPKGMMTLFAGGQQPYQQTSAESNILKESFAIV